MHRFAFLLLIVLHSFSSFAQSLSGELDEYIEAARKIYNVPGLSVAVVKDGKVVHNQGYGVLETGSETKADGSTFHADMYGKVLVEKEGKNLRLRFVNSPLLSATLKHWQNNSFEIVWDHDHAWFGFGLAEFRVENGNIEGLTLNIPNYDIFFDEYELKKIE